MLATHPGCTNNQPKAEVLVRILLKISPCVGRSSLLKVRHSVFSIFCLILVSGCASMSKSECANANWQARGFADGENGSPVSLLDRHTKACSRIDIHPDEVLYRKGHSEGVKLYCTPRKGLSLGRNNSTYYDVCPASLEPAFLLSLIDGLELKLFELQQQSFSAESKLFQLRLQLAVAQEADKKAISADISNQENILSDINSTQLSIRTRISEYRLRAR